MFKGKGKGKDRPQDSDDDSYSGRTGKEPKPGASGRFWRPAPYAAIAAAGQFLDGGPPNDRTSITHKSSARSQAKGALEPQRHVGYGTELMFVDERGLLWRDIEEKQEYTHLLSDSRNKRHAGWDQFNDRRSSTSASTDEGRTPEDEDFRTLPSPLEAAPRRQPVAVSVRRQRSATTLSPSCNPNSVTIPPPLPINLPLPLPPPHTVRTRSGSRVVQPSSHSSKRDPPRPTTAPSRDRTSQERIREAREDFLKSSFNPPPVLFASPPSQDPGSNKSPMSKIKASRRLSSPVAGLVSPDTKFGGLFQRRGSLAPTTTATIAPPPAPSSRRPSLTPGPHGPSSLHRSFFETEKARLTREGGLPFATKKQSNGSLRDIFKKATFF